jgi:thioredoxin 1
LRRNLLLRGFEGDLSISLTSCQEHIMNRRLFLALSAALLPIPALAQSAAPAVASAVRPFTQASFDAARTSGAVIVHVHADWCPTCRRQEPIVNSLSADPAFRGVSVFRANFDRETAFRTTNRIPGQATLLVFKGGAEVGRSTGVVDAAQIRELLSRAL